MTAIDSNNLLSTCTSYRFLQQNADSCFCPNCKPFPWHLFGRAGHSFLHFFNGFWCSLLPVKSIVLNDPVKEWILPSRRRRPDNPGVQRVVFYIHQLHCIQSGAHNSSRECLSCPFDFCRISPVDCWDDVTISKLGHEINRVALKQSKLTMEERDQSEETPGYRGFQPLPQMPSGWHFLQLLG